MFHAARNEEITMSCYPCYADIFGNVGCGAILYGAYKYTVSSLWPSSRTEENKKIALFFLTAGFASVAVAVGLLYNVSEDVLLESLPNDLWGTLQQLSSEGAETVTAIFQRCISSI